ncbi:MAG: acetyl-CoA carboxylase carboxyl transferase subunit beta, partial [Myxococcota bacterium]
MPKGVWTKCEACGATLYEPELNENARVCKHCGHHFRLPFEGRLQLIADEGSWDEHDLGLVSSDPLEFRIDSKRYTDQLKAAAQKSGAPDAYRWGSATVGGYPAELGFFVFKFMGGSM